MIKFKKGDFWQSENDSIFVIKDIKKTEYIVCEIACSWDHIGQKYIFDLNGNLIDIEFKRYYYGRDRTEKYEYKLVKKIDAIVINSIDELLILNKKNIKIGEYEIGRKDALKIMKNLANYLGYETKE